MWPIESIEKRKKKKREKERLNTTRSIFPFFFLCIFFFFFVTLLTGMTFTDRLGSEEESLVGHCCGKSLREKGWKEEKLKVEKRKRRA